MKLKSVLLLVTLLSFACDALAQKATDAVQRDTSQDCRSFVQQFYDWYVPVALKDQKETALNIAMRVKPTAFDHELLRLLKRDSDAQSKSTEIVGLDFDPILFSQDPSERFAVHKVKKMGAVCLVTVFGYTSGKHGETVIPEVRMTSGRWQFVNFHYGNKALDLIHLLKEAADVRRKSVLKKR